jgi:H+-translocating NAD(P) transhydrogenase subunit alpha
LVPYRSDEMGGASGYKIDVENDIIRGSLVLEGGAKRWPPPPPKKVEPEVKSSQEGKLPATAVSPLVPQVKATPAPHKTHGAPAPSPPSKAVGTTMSILGLIAVAAWMMLRFAEPKASVSPETFALLQHLTVFVLAIFVGWQVVWNVTPALHTPLMSVTNAISGIIVVGGLMNGSSGHLGTPEWVAIAATLFATINIAGGFLVTRRMLAMFRK